ncbi:MAG: enoyl-CoA hydratase-related protein [candidate division KSB1 bacterium]|nr:enoyl-CoA hydratase-related protein [candidate division KSB1 bacterium]
MADAVVTYSRTESIGYITLNRPPANSYEIGFMRDLDAAIDAANADAEAKAVIVKSALDKFFSAGADIKAFMANSTPQKHGNGAGGT